MSKGMDLFVNALIKNQNECVAYIKQGKKDEAFLSFLQYVFFLFPIREKLQLRDKDSTVFHALKNYYNAIKHQGDLDALYELNNFCPGALFATADGVLFATADGVLFGTGPNIVFGDATALAKLSGFREPKKESAMISLHNKHLKGKNVSSIIELTTEDTIKHYENSRVT